jgi:hypothetical protein
VIGHANLAESLTAPSIAHRIRAQRPPSVLFEQFGALFLDLGFRCVISVPAPRDSAHA